MSKAQVIRELGSPDVMQWQEWPVPDPAPGEVRLRHTAIGVNFADTYHRGGISHPWIVPPCPVVIGFEGVGIVEGVGDGVSEFKTGDRVAYGIPPLGSYAEVRNYPADKLLHLPDGLDDKTVAARQLFYHPDHLANAIVYRPDSCAPRHSCQAGECHKPPGHRF